MSALVSIIMPVYNAEEYIVEAIQSVLSQSYVCWELLVINDGSTDDTEGRIRSFDDLRIRYFKQRNMGVSAARNVGLSCMQGDYFCFLDADDVMPPNSVKSRLELFLQDKRLSFVDGLVLIKNVSLSKTTEKYIPNFSGYPFSELTKLSDRCFLGNTWMIKRLKNETYRFEEGLTHSEDLLFYLNIAEQGTYAATEEVVLWYRTGNSSAMSNLEGLEHGYAEFYRAVRKARKSSIRQRWYLKYKIIRIMVFSYLKLQHSPEDAFRVFFRYIKL